MAEAAAARREARRKRILENSHNRLQFISGKIGNEHSNVTETTTSSPVFNVSASLSDEPDSCSSNKSLLYNGSLFSESETLQLLSPRHDDNTTDDTQITNDFIAHGASDSAVNEVPSALAKICLNKYDIVLMSLLIQILYGVSASSFDGIYFFVPLVIYSVTKQLWFPTKLNSSIALAMLFLNSLPRSGLNKIMFIVQWLGVLSQDLCVFLFTTICIQSVYIYIKEMLIT